MATDESQLSNSNMDVDQDSETNISPEKTANTIESNQEPSGSSSNSKPIPNLNSEQESEQVDNVNNSTPVNTNFLPGVNPLGATQPPPLNKNNILEALEEFDSSIPDAVVHHYLNISGMQTSDQRIIRLIAIAAQKFIHDVVSDSLQHCKLRGAQGKKTKEKKYTLAIEDLSSALSEYGIEVGRQLYFN